VLTDIHFDGTWSWFSYLVRTPQDAFDITLNVSPPETGTAGTAAADICIDGTLKGTLDLTPSGASAALRTPMLSAGTHGLLIKAASGAFGVNSVSAMAVGGSSAPPEEAADVTYVTPTYLEAMWSVASSVL
jgi:hypothetical protein